MCAIETLFYQSSLSFSSPFSLSLSLTSSPGHMGYTMGGCGLFKSSQQVIWCDLVVSRNNISPLLTFPLTFIVLSSVKLHVNNAD